MPKRPMDFNEQEEENEDVLSLLEGTPQDCFTLLFNHLDAKSKANLRLSSTTMRDKVDATERQHVAKQLYAMQTADWQLDVGAKCLAVSPGKGLYVSACAFVRDLNEPVYGHYERLKFTPLKGKEFQEVPFFKGKQIQKVISSQHKNNFHLIVIADNQLYYLTQSRRDYCGFGYEEHIDKCFYGRVVIRTPEFLLDKQILCDDTGEPMVGFLGINRDIIVATNEGVFTLGGMFHSYQLKYHQYDFDYTADDSPCSFLPGSVIKLEQFSGKTVKKLNAGLGKIMLATDEELYIWGYNVKGHLGLGHLTSLYIPPTVIPDFTNANIQHLASGNMHTIVVADNRLYTFGDNSEGALGKPGKRKKTTVPKELEFFRDKQILQVAAGAFHSVVWTQQGIYVWGDNQCGQLGLDSSVTEVTSPVKLNFFYGMNIQNVVAGDDCTVIVADNELYVFGENPQHVLGIADVDNVSVPKPLAPYHFVDKACSAKVQGELTEQFGEKLEMVGGTTADSGKTQSKKESKFKKSRHAFVKKLTNKFRSSTAHL